MNREKKVDEQYIKVKSIYIINRCFECEVSLEEREEIMNSKWFNNWTIEYEEFLKEIL